ncbi:GGDEF domain-containing protein [Shewanella pneumatophori]|uniref:diguanylate cyclase n=1 Tax=Shewanella pneumatophori TaxID=314092 RepID=A0A9X1ZHH5_9GAMM|nr:GGDEF domain-containing protein [Shewanella pneumatophori]MCL1137923.1 diguanylate cyclase [Shewanella pneumatophori]
MSSLKIVWILIITFVFISASRADENSDITNLLQTADNIRSSNPKDFNIMLEDLEDRHDEFSTEQLHYFNYLNAYRFAFQGKFEDSLELWKQVSLAKSSPLLSFRANLSLVNIYAISKNWADGLTHLAINLDILPQITEPEFQELGLLIAAMFYNQLGQYELGLKYANRLGSQLSQGRNYCLAKQLALESQFKLGQLSEDSAQIAQGLQACQQSNEVVMESAIYSYLAELYLDNNQPLQAIATLEKQLVAIEQTKYAPILAQYYALLADSYFQTQSYSLASDFASKATSQTQNIANSKPEVTAYNILFQIAESRGEHQQALAYHREYAAADKAYLDEVKTKHLAFQLAQHQATEQKNQIKLLDDQNRLLRLEQKLSRSETENNRLFISLLFVSILLLVGMVYKSRTTQKRLKLLAEYDALTKVHNRGHFTQLALSAIDYCSKNKQVASCILFDLDKFKSINDTYGHATGDWVLKQVANVCQSQCRKNDLFARLGGEEFCIFLPSCDVATAAQLAEEYRKLIATIDSKDSGFEFAISASFGVTDFSLSGTNLDKMVADSDHAMYVSKKTGRNRVTIFSDGIAEFKRNKQANSAISNQTPEAAIQS